MDTRGDDLVERSLELERLEASLESVRNDGRGRLVLIAGEAGLGKTSLVRAFCGDDRRSARVLAGACDALFTPRPLGPLLDIAAEAGGALADIASEGASPAALVAALADELRRRPTSVVVLEDLHWADEATLDVLRLLARRVESTPALFLATYRHHELDRAHPLRVVLGELPPGRAIERLVLSPLSADAVAALAEPTDVDAAELYRTTGGNPFYVTEVLAAGGAAVPETVRDAVLARVARLEPGARALLDAVAIVPPHAELWLLEALAPDALPHLDECLASGMLRAERDVVGFRHEIARVAVEETLPPDVSVALHRKALETLAGTPGRHPDPARLAHHADGAGDSAAVLVHAPLAGERAAALGAHREAAAQFERALRHADGLPSARRAELLERRSYECYLTDAIDDAIHARRAALAEHRQEGDRLREGDGHRWLSRLAWFVGANAAAEVEARRAIELLEPLPPGRELAMAYSNMAHLRMLAGDRAGTADWGQRAIGLAERFGDAEILSHALNNVGSAEIRAGAREGVGKLERSLQIALDAGLEEHVARAHTNLGTVAVAIRDYSLAARHLNDGITYSLERDLDSWVMYMTGWRARLHFDQGAWDRAAEDALAVLMRPGVPASSRITPLVVIGQLRARRGDPDPWPSLDEAHALAGSTGELQRLAPVAAARAEAHWLAGDVSAVATETDKAFALAIELVEQWTAGELWSLRRRAGIVDAIDADHLAPPYRLELTEDFEGAASAWAVIGCPYEAALSLASSSDEALLRRSHAELQELGALPAARWVARLLRERGARDVRRGPHASTRENPAGLTGRELEVVALLAEGLRNAEIAARLFLSEKTVAHHVSSILRKLDVETRGQAAAEAARLGIAER